MPSGAVTAAAGILRAVEDTYALAGYCLSGGSASTEHRYQLKVIPTGAAAQVLLLAPETRGWDQRRPALVEPPIQHRRQQSCLAGTTPFALQTGGTLAGDIPFSSSPVMI